MNVRNDESKTGQPEAQHAATSAAPADAKPNLAPAAPAPQEFGGRKGGLEPTRYGDWEKDGRCIDF